MTVAPRYRPNDAGTTLVLNQVVAVFAAGEIGITSACWIFSVGKLRFGATVVTDAKIVNAIAARSLVMGRYLS
jgi:spore coat protein U-like protein